MAVSRLGGAGFLASTALAGGGLGAFAKSEAENAAAGIGLGSVAVGTLGMLKFVNHASLGASLAAWPLIFASGGLAAAGTTMLRSDS